VLVCVREGSNSCAVLCVCVCVCARAHAFRNSRASVLQTISFQRFNSNLTLISSHPFLLSIRLSPSQPAPVLKFTYVRLCEGASASAGGRGTRACPPAIIFGCLAIFETTRGGSALRYSTSRDFQRYAFAQFMNFLDYVRGRGLCLRARVCVYARARAFAQTAGF
jgi:hypothetical protein